MKMTAAAFAVALAALPLAGCHSCDGQARFWSVNDGACFTVDTPGTPLGQRIGAVFVDGTGRKCATPSSVRMAPMTESEWVASTGGAGYQLSYCPKLQACWALPSEK